MRNGPNGFGLDKGKHFHNAINGRNFGFEGVILEITPVFF
jgi:hypothetical protein